MRKQPSLYGQKIITTPNFLGTTEASFLWHIGQIFKICFISSLSVHSPSVPRDLQHFPSCYNRILSRSHSLSIPKGKMKATIGVFSQQSIKTRNVVCSKISVQLPLPSSYLKGKRRSPLAALSQQSIKTRNVVSEYPLVAQWISNGCGMWIECARIPRAKPTTLTFLLQQNSVQLPLHSQWGN